MIQYLLTASVIVNYTQMVMASRILVHGRRGDIGQRVQHRADKGLDTKPESVWSGENVLEETTVHQLVTQTKHVQVGSLVLQLLLYLKNYLGQLVYFPFTNSSVRPLSTVCVWFSIIGVLTSPFANLIGLGYLRNYIHIVDACVSIRLTDAWYVLVLSFEMRL